MNKTIRFTLVFSIAAILVACSAGEEISPGENSSPTTEPSPAPTLEPTIEPTIEPTTLPSPEPIIVPTAAPSPEPTIVPTAAPSPEPTIVPTAEPSPEPSLEPSPAPTPQPSTPPTALTDEPNILFVIADDLGLDASNQYSIGNDLPTTPTLDALANEGVVFDNVWATPACTTTRGTLITGLHGINSGVDRVPSEMDTSLNTLQRHLTNQAENYASAVIGKWHIGGGANSSPTHPTLSGIPYYAGTINGTIQSYFNWPLVLNGEFVDEPVETYHTTVLTDMAIDWISEQEDSPWFMWLAYVAPHIPFHIPPEGLYNRSLNATDNSNRELYLAAIEAMDTEIGRLIDSLPDEDKDNTIIIFIGDNGSPTQAIDTRVFEREKSKSSLYEGGIRVPLIISGADINRKGEREDALVNSVDIYATIAELAGAPVEHNIDGISFAAVLNDASADPRNYNYSEFVSDNVTGWTVRNTTFKLIVFADGTQELYNIADSLSENINLINDENYSDIIIELENHGLDIRGETPTSTGGGEGGGTNNPIDITNAIFEEQSADCVDYVNTYSADVEDALNNLGFEADVIITADETSCNIQSNNVPNHNFQDNEGGFANPFQEQANLFVVNRTPELADNPTELNQRMFNAVMLNGVVVDLLSAGCYDPDGQRPDEDGDVRIGCGADSAWLLDPVGSGKFATDSHNAHTQANGTYHYHGDPQAMFDDNPGPNGSPLIGFAADGFPIFGSYIFDAELGSVREVQSSYALKTGNRPTGEGNPGGEYDGRYEQDWEFTGNGDLDECNGMTHNGYYAYYVTNAFPWILKCLSGTPDASFNK